MEAITGECPLRNWLSRDLTSDLDRCVACEQPFRKGDEVVIENVIAVVESDGPVVIHPIVPLHLHCAGLWPQMLYHLLKAPDQDTFVRLVSRILGQTASRLVASKN